LVPVLSQPRNGGTHASMTVISLYHWDYDHRAPSAEPFRTFSIAIFQWQPKASGKGLKKVNASRVCGYAADPKAMYEKAQQICARLNVEKATVQARPTWLQKQYSVPRPKFVAPKTPKDYLPPSVVRSIRRSVMKRILLPLGFIEAGNATYVRRENDQIHLIYFQGSKWGGSYTVNLGFHYAFMKPFFARKRIPLSKFDLLDCAFQARIGPFKVGRDQWFDYGTDRKVLGETFEQNVTDSLKILSRYSKKWADPWKWLLPSTREALSKRLTWGSWDVQKSDRLISELDWHYREGLQNEMLSKIKTRGFSASDRLGRDEVHERKLR